MTQSLQLIVQQNYQNLTDTDILASLETAVTISSGDSTPYTWSGLTIALLGRGVLISDIAAFQATVSSLPLGGLLNSALLSGGFNCVENLSLLQSSVADQTGSILNVLNGMIAIGSATTSTQWQVLGLNSLPSQSDIDEAIHEVAVINQITLQMTTSINPLIGSGTATVTQLQAAVAAMSNAVQGI